jgi:hypothetical protein
MKQQNYNCTQTCIFTQDDWLQCVVQTKVETSVHNDTNTRYGKTSVQPLDAITLQGFSVHINETVELTFSAFSGRLCVVGQPGSSIIQRVHKDEGHCTSATTSNDILGEFHGRRICLLDLENSFYFIFESKVKSLRWEVTDAVGQITSPER